LAEGRNRLKVTEPMLDAVLYVGDRLLPWFPRSASADEAPIRAVDRLAVHPRFSPSTFQCSARASKPAAVVARPRGARCHAVLRAGPVGDATAATATSKSGIGIRRRCSRASRRSQRWFLNVTGSSPASSLMMTSSSARGAHGRLGLRDPDHDAVRRQRAWSGTEHRAPAGQVIEQHDDAPRPTADCGREADDARAQA